jgi:hypothetical protein
MERKYFIGQTERLDRKCRVWQNFSDWPYIKLGRPVKQLAEARLRP